LKLIEICILLIKKNELKYSRYIMNTNNMTTHSGSAYLEIILGGMYAGKTSHLVEIYKQCKFCNIPVIVINHAIDTRYDDEFEDDLLSTHDKVKIPCMKTERLMDLWIESLNLEAHAEILPRIKDKFIIRSSEVILINEGQFFPDLEEFVKLLLNDGKKVYVCGLDGDFERKKFGQILDLIPHCDKVTKLTSLCSLCKNGTPGIFSMRLTRETDQTVVGSDSYIPVCRSCYVKKINQ
jgi:thymidine kinase